MTNTGPKKACERYMGIIRVEASTGSKPSANDRLRDALVQEISQQLSSHWKCLMGNLVNRLM